MRSLLIPFSPSQQFSRIEKVHSGGGARGSVFLFAQANAANMDIFDEVDMESSHIDDQLLAYTLPLKPQDATAAGSRQPKAIRRKVDEVPLGAESGETRAPVVKT